MAKKNGIGFGRLDKTKKENFIQNKPKDDKNQALKSTVEGDKCIGVSENTSLSKKSISLSIKLQQKLKIPKKRVGITKDNWNGEIFH